MKYIRRLDDVQALGDFVWRCLVKVRNSAMGESETENAFIAHLMLSFNSMGI
jgi:hypothetical protein